MAQHDYDIANADGATVRADLNALFEAIASWNNGTTAPSPTFAYMRWVDTANNLAKVRNGANTAWVTIASISSGVWVPYSDGTALSIGTNVGDLLQLVGIGSPAVAGLPAVDGSQLTGIVTSKVGSFTRDISLASGSQAITGVGFQPTAVLFLSNVTTTAQISVGVDDGTNVGAVIDNNGGSTDTYVSGTSNSISLRVDGSNRAEAAIQSLDSDGFTLSWTKTGFPTGTATMIYLAWG